MTAALGLPIALVLGVLTALVSGIVRRLGGRGRTWWPELGGFDRDARLLLRGGKERPTPLEAGGAMASFLGSALAADAALGAVASSMAFVYLALLLAAAGAHVAAVDASTALREDAVARARRAWAAAEPGFVLGFAAALARWRAVDLDAVRGANDVLGPGPSVGPTLAAAGLVAGVAVVVVTGALRMVPASEAVRGSGRRAGGALLIALCRWGLAGATSLVSAVLLVGGSAFTPEGSVAVPEDVVLPAAVAVGAAVLVGVVDGLASVFVRRRAILGAAAMAVAAGAGAAVAFG
jgi:hypothetical protein